MEEFGEALRVANCVSEPLAVRTGVVRPAYHVTQGENPVYDFRLQRGALFGGEVSREAQGGFRVVHGAKGGVDRRREIKNLILDVLRKVFVVEPNR